MKVTLWGTRGSIAHAGPTTVRYGGDTASVEVRDTAGHLIILDAGSGIRAIEATPAGGERIDILLTHLHMDHVQGLPFFAPLLSPDYEVHLWGPVSTRSSLKLRLARYLSPPLFPVSVRDLPNVVFHDVMPGEFKLRSISVQADLVSHPGTTLGFRLEENGSTLAYLPDHEPALGVSSFPGDPEWTSGFDLTHDVDVLIHDSQYTDDEYDERVGWGHTSFSHLSAFAELSAVAKLVTFHHDPSHGDDMLDRVHDELHAAARGYELVAGKRGLVIDC